MQPVDITLAITLNIYCTVHTHTHTGDFSFVWLRHSAQDCVGVQTVLVNMSLTLLALLQSKNK